MVAPADTIVAIATPAGRGGLGVVRLSGPGAQAVAGRLLGRGRPLRPRHATFARVRDPEAPRGLLDQVVVTLFAAPRSFTGEDVVEVSTHGNPWILCRVVELAAAHGARVAEPGEFSFRAYLNGRLDLVEAEAVADLVAAVTPAQARAACEQLEGSLTTAIGAIEQDLFSLAAKLEASIDFPEEGYRFVEPGAAAAALRDIRAALDALLATAKAGRVLREGRHLALVGQPNVGKSSIFNTLLGYDRAIVSAAPGTTRDLITETCDVDGIPLTLVDTAGWRRASDEVEVEGIRRAEGARAAADVSLLVLDGSRPLAPADWELVAAMTGAHVVAVNKSDLPEAWPLSALGDRQPRALRVSAATGDGLGALRDALARALVDDEHQLADVRVTNVRHARLLGQARDLVDRATGQAAAAASEELVLADVHEALSNLQQVTGRRAPDAVLREIFSRFCIGK